MPTARSEKSPCTSGPLKNGERHLFSPRRRRDRPYERRRTGDLAGTWAARRRRSCGTALRGGLSNAAGRGPSTDVAPGMTGSPVGSSTIQPAPRAASCIAPVGTTGAWSRRLPHAPGFRRSADRGHQRRVPSVSGCPLVRRRSSRRISADRFGRIGEHRGFNVYEEKGSPGRSTCRCSTVRGADCAVQDAVARFALRATAAKPRFAVRGSPVRDRADRAAGLKALQTASAASFPRSVDGSELRTREPANRGLRMDG